MVRVIACPGLVCVAGHANTAAKGNDLVCSALSALLQNFILSTEELTNAKVKSDLASGRALIEYEESPQAQLLADSFFIGAQGVEKAYPQCVRTVDCRGRRVEALTTEKQGKDRPTNNDVKL